MKLFVLFYLFFIVSSRIIKFNYFLKQNLINKKLKLYLQQNIKDPIMIIGENSFLKKEYCRYHSFSNNMKFYEYNYTDFIQKIPIQKYDNSMIYLKGCTLKNNINKKYLSMFYKSNNAIIFDIDEIKDCDNVLIPFYFPKISKVELTNYIYDLIEYHKYHEDLLLLNWNAYDIETLNLPILNVLLKNLNNSIKKENIPIEKIHYHINSIISSIRDYYKKIDF